VNLFGLPDIVFAEKDPDTIKRDIISGYESAYQQATGEMITLYPGDPRRLFLLTVAEVIILQRNLIDWTAKQNLLAYTTEEREDHMGLLLGVARLPAQRARTTIRFILSAPQQSATLIPAGTRVTPSGRNIYFATEDTLEIPAGELSGDVLALSTEQGSMANGFLPGQVNRLVDPLPWIASVENITESSGGADVENDESLRERIHLAPESFSVAGPTGAYKFWAKTAHQGIIDISVVGPPYTAPGNVEIYPLMENGELPSQEILELVYNICSAEDIRPDTDHVFVFEPEPVEFDISITYWIDRRYAAQATAIVKSVQNAISEWELWQRTALGRDINPSELNHRMVAAGAKRTEITTPTFMPLSYKQVGITGAKEVLYGGLEDG
jgi:phage-related baseplate assembly protein